MVMPQKIRILSLEDTPSDAELIRRELFRAGLDFEWHCVDNEVNFKQSLNDFRPDIVLADYKLPSYNGSAALQHVRTTHPTIPLIIVTGTLGEEKAVELFRTGAADYVLKDRLARLPDAVQHALENAQARQERTIEQRRLVESEEWLRQAQAIAHLGIWRWELTENLIYWSDESFRIFGLAADELGHDPLSFIEYSVFPEDRENVRAAIADVIASKGPYVCEFRVARPDGSIRWVQGNGDLILDVHGSPLRLIGTNLDITEKKEAEIQRLAMLNQIRSNLLQFVHAMSDAIEKRDPYTAGHQRRVAELSHAIAMEMGWSLEQCEAISIIGLLHDLGKISLPAEILSKPGRLSEIEFMLVRTHPQQGYEILSKIDFPWPVALAVCQHHERMDGTGYPNGLKGEQIVIEARVLAVADVIEAMASHRPYRPGLGIEAALEEIEAGKGIQYDTEVVEASIRLFRDKDFQLPL